MSEASTMRGEYDVFESFPDGSTLWRGCVTGRYEAQRKIQELREHSENDFTFLDMNAQCFIPTKVTTRTGLEAKATAGG
jgi:hypothetical protein